jgi:hypothetical protein
VGVTAGVTLMIDGYFEDRTRGTESTYHSGAWGELEELDARFEQPDEYVGFEKVSAEGPLWTFGTMTGPAIHDILLSVGMTEEQTTKLLATRLPGTAGIAVLKPDEESVLSLTPEVRSKLYLALAQNPANRFQNTPYFIPNADLEKIFQGHQKISAATRDLMKRLLYQRNGFTYFSDPETVIKHVSSEEERFEVLKALTGQNIVQMRLMIHPDSDIDKSLNYWGLAVPWILVKDLRPLFESLRRLPAGGSISIPYLLPPLARERLFTSPLPPASGDSKLPDCHWSALNFFAMTPDQRMSENDFASQYIARNYYEIGKPGIEGDLVLLMNSENRVVHSSVYLADDIVFTKNGINFAQPWVTMRIKDMVGDFSALEPVKIAYFRRKDM